MSMAGTTRRRLLTGLMAAGGILALAPPLRALASAPLPLPGGPLRLTRELVRELGDGTAISVRRGWDVTFARQARGIMIAGTQVSASVDAPPSLADLARIEQQRSTAAMFPIMLTDAGLILASGTANAAPDDMAAALRAAEKMIAARPQSEGQRDNLRRYLAEIHRAGAGQFEALPPDLFVPAGTPLRRVEPVSLPGGMTGAFELVWEARANPDTGWLVSGQRQIITRIAELERRSREVWTLDPI
jgi:hypothetical protein